MSKKKKKGKGSPSGKQAQAIALLGKLDTEGDPKNSAIETTKDLIIGVVGGGLTGAAIGKPSLLVGFGTSLMGHYLNQPIIKSLGFGMMASGGYQIGSSFSGTEGLEGAKERVKAFTQNLKERLYLDKVLDKAKARTAAKPTTEEGTNGMGEVQYFRYPANQPPLDMGALNNLEKSLEEMGRQYARQSGRSVSESTEGTEQDIGGPEDERLY